VSPYVGRFAPSPSGPLHAGSLVAALASWLDARAHGGRWLVRIEDVDAQRCDAAWVPVILDQLARCGLQPDAPPVRQSERGARYQAAMARLQAQGHVYACDCSRQAIRLASAPRPASAGADEEMAPPYPGTCRDRGLQAGSGSAIAWRLRTGDAAHPVVIDWSDRRLGFQTQHLGEAVGDFVLRRRDGLWAYQLAVVVDDAEQGITDVVRGEDLVGNTARQIHLQRLLGLPTPRYLHTPLVRDAQGRKLSKHTGAAALSLDTPEAVQGALRAAAQALELAWPEPSGPVASLSDGLQAAVAAWRDGMMSGR
jgi:glutamyl-Q tRNA(Asp) synthetase